MKGTNSAGSDSDSDSDDFDELPVDFEMFDPQPAHDFHGLKILIRQLFDIDSTLFDISALANLVLSQPLVGTTIKVDTNESDPYAFLTVLNVNLHRKTNPAVETLVNYILEKSKVNEKLHEQLSRILNKKNGAEKGGLGLILTERMVNMPVEVVPPMYKMLQEEVQWALDEKESYDFEAYLILSKTYTEVASQLEAEDSAEEEEEIKPKAKKFKSRMRDEVFYFHPEDEVLHVEAIAYTDYNYTKVPEAGTADSKRTFSDFGIVPQGHMILFKKDNLGHVVRKLENTFKPF
ncbi:p21-C-terminal region-binding protein-domain-containing protein [Terfezia claveryi]|nr:p21-C-terminal region-binding protein-domain-containing protein [Terfezia claveryi]